MDTEAGNLRAARRWCGRDPGRAAAGLRLAAGIYQYWHIFGHLAEATGWMKEALATDGGPEQARAMALNGLGLMYCFREEPARGRELFTASVECFRRSPDGRAKAVPLPT
jgi:hypothetical protein